MIKFDGLDQDIRILRSLTELGEATASDLNSLDKNINPSGVKPRLDRMNEAGWITVYVVNSEPTYHITPKGIRQARAIERRRSGDIGLGTGIVTTDELPSLLEKISNVITEGSKP